MSIPLFLAMTATDFSFTRKKPEQLAWMSVHFSQSNGCLSNLPPSLPPGSLIILDDQIPWNDHDLERICQCLTRLLVRDRSYGLLLDFEREPCQETLTLAKALTQCCLGIGCRIAMPRSYLTEGAACFCPPIPCNESWSEKDFSGGPVWLDVTPTAVLAEISSKGVRIDPADPHELNGWAKNNSVFRDPTLGCFYHSYREGECVRVSLFDTPQTVWDKLQSPDPRIQLAITPWREFSDPKWYTPSMST